MSEHLDASAVVQLFRSQLAPGATLAALAGAPWLDRSSIATIDAVTGKLPVPYDPADTVVVLRVVGALAAEISAIYLRISGRWSRDQIAAGLDAAIVGQIVRAYAILDADHAILASA